jgi:hypothetical protein
MDNERFDGLIRVLGQGTTRRGTLAVLAGLAGLGLGEAAAKRRHRGRRAKQGTRASAAKPPKCTATKSSNSACAQFCAATFGAGTPEASQCTSDAAKCQGQCYQCGPGCGASCKKTRCGQQCVTTTSDPSHCGASCTTCTGGNDCTTATCVSGVCGTTPTNAGGSCDGGTGTCNAGTCVPNPPPPAVCENPRDGCEPPARNCGPDNTCSCTFTVDGDAVCTAGGRCGACETCRDSEVCVAALCCPTETSCAIVCAG